MAALAAVVMVGAAAGSASARLAPQQQPQQKLQPPSPGKEDESRPIFAQYLVLVAIVGAAVGANLIPSKRGHQD